jgi:hypothetical protein
MHRPKILLVASAFVLAATASVAAQDAGRGAGSTQSSDPSPFPDPRSDAPGRSQMLSPDEQRTIAGILKQEGAPADDAGLDDLEAGAIIPRTTTLRPLPRDVVDIAPGYADYSYVALKGRICIVDPQTLRIIAVLPAA